MANETRKDRTNPDPAAGAGQKPVRARQIWPQVEAGMTAAEGHVPYIKQ